MARKTPYTYDDIKWLYDIVGDYNTVEAILPIVTMCCLDVRSRRVYDMAVAFRNLSASATVFALEE